MNGLYRDKLPLRITRKSRSLNGEIIPTIIVCLEGGLKELKESIQRIFKYDNNDKELEQISQEIQKSEPWESKSLIRKVLSGMMT